MSDAERIASLEAERLELLARCDRLQSRVKMLEGKLTGPDELQGDG